MKLFVASTVAVISNVNAGSVSCDINGSDTPLFEMECDAETAEMVVTVNEACRMQDYSHIDFQNSFVQGDEAVNSVDDINADCLATNEYAPQAVDGSWEWTITLNGDCVTTDSYDVFWKAGKTLSITVRISCNSKII